MIHKLKYGKDHARKSYQQHTPLNGPVTFNDSLIVAIKQQGFAAFLLQIMFANENNMHILIPVTRLHTNVNSFIL